MCGICSAYGHMVGSAMYAVQKVVTCFALTAVTTCVITTILIMLGVGIGLGYHYCLVQSKTRHMSGFGENKVQLANESSTANTTTMAQEAQQPPADPKAETPADPKGEKPAGETNADTPKVERRRNVMVVPLDGALDLTSLISKIISMKKNFTLEFIS